LIEIKNLSFSIARKRILDSISFTIDAGEYLSIIGPNGAGKSTLLKCLMRIYPVETGMIHFRGVLIQKFSQKALAREICYVPQSDGRFFPFTVEEFILLGRYPYLSPFTSVRQTDKAAVHQALTLTQTSHLAKRQINTLSGGEKQIVFIAAALAQGSPILLLDEPTTFLDPKHESEIYRILRKLNQQLKMTIIVVTHNINQAALQSDRLIILKNGQLTFCGPASQIMTNDILAPAYDMNFRFMSHPTTGQTVIAPEVIHDAP